MFGGTRSGREEKKTGGEGPADGKNLDRISFRGGREAELADREGRLEAEIGTACRFGVHVRQVPANEAPGAYAKWLAKRTKGTAGGILSRRGRNIPVLSNKFCC